MDSTPVAIQFAESIPGEGALDVHASPSRANNRAWFCTTSPATHEESDWLMEEVSAEA